MADKKISQLTASTTPLAGTEVLPIVQGGATVKVSVANLTAGRAVTMASNTMVAATALNDVDNTGGGSYSYRAKGNDQANVRFRFENGGAGGQIFELVGGNPGASNAGFCLLDVTNGAKRLYVTSTGDVQAVTGNFVIGTAGKGIDFSADPSAAGMTSELLDDYEEGTFTCTMTASSSGTITINSGYRTGKYTKIGRQVNVCGFLVIDSVSSPVGAASINGLPFACGPNDSNLSAASFEIRSSAFPAGASVQGRIESNQTGFSVSSFASGTIADAAAYITGGTQITFNLTYFVN